MCSIWSSKHCTVAYHSSICLFMLVYFRCNVAGNDFSMLDRDFSCNMPASKAAKSRTANIYNICIYTVIWALETQLEESMSRYMYFENATDNGHASEQMSWRRNVMVLRTNCNALPRVSATHHMHFCTLNLKEKTLCKLLVHMRLKSDDMPGVYVTYCYAGICTTLLFKQSDTG